MITPEERTRRSKDARAAAIAATRPTTRPGSETSELVTGDRVAIQRDWASVGSWIAYDGRTGWVSSVNTQTFSDGSTYTEIGVSWTRPTDNRNPGADAWFRTDEVKRA